MTTKTLVEGWYDEHAESEEHRLDDGRLEFEVTKRVVGGCITKLGRVGLKILDIGGGPGKYAIDLAKQGHAVTLNDLSKKSLQIAWKNAEKESVTFEATIHANALDIKQHTSEDSFDMVLCLGPLYHLLRPNERMEVIKNSIYAAKSGGYIVLAFVTIYAHLRDMARHDPSRLSKEWEFYKTYLHDGIYTRKTNNESYHVYPADLEKELEGLERHAKVLKVVSCEGFLGFEGARALVNLRDEELEQWIDVVMQSADDNQTLNAADHLIVLLQKD